MSTHSASSAALLSNLADLTIATFAFLNEGMIDHIMNKLEDGMSYTKYMQLYT